MNNVQDTTSGKRTCLLEYITNLINNVPDDADFTFNFKWERKASPERRIGEPSSTDSGFTFALHMDVEVPGKESN